MESSSSHAWNRVALDDVWYIIDCTRDCKPSDGGSKPGVPLKITDIADEPELTYTNEEFSLSAYGADKIYYTVNGREPAVGQRRSFVYSTPVLASDGTVVTAMAVADPKSNSAVKSWRLESGTAEPVDPPETDPTDPEPVNPDPEDPTDVTISIYPSSIDLEVGDTYYFTAYTDPYDAEVTWSSSNEEIATVDEYGYVRAVGKGTATITASCGNASDSATVTVQDGDDPEFIPDKIICEGEKRSAPGSLKCKR